MKAIFVLALLLMSFVSVHAQMRRTGNTGSGVEPEERFYGGGGGGFGFGTNSYNGFRYSYFSINPIVGVNITRQLSMGPIGYYQSYRYPSQGVSLNQYGGGAFANTGSGNCLHGLSIT